MSGGMDSRLILSKLVEKRYRKILAFSYGIRGNSDSKIAAIEQASKADQLKAEKDKDKDKEDEC